MTRIRAVIFDVDGVLTTIDSIWRYIHVHLGTWEKAKKYAEMYKRGEITYKEWAELDVSLWRGTPRKKIEEIVATIPLREGAHDLVRELRRKGVKTGAISAGLDVITDRVASELGLDTAISNRLVYKDSKVTGEVEVLVGYGDKGRIFLELCDQLGVRPEEAAAVGDSEVDLHMFEEAGLPIAFNPKKPSVSRKALIVIKASTLKPLTRVLYYLT